MKQEIIELLRRQTGEVCRPASLAQIKSAEEELQLVLPVAVKDWLVICNGSLGGAGGIFGVDQENSFIDLAARLRLYPNWLSKRWIPVATDGCGNHYVVVNDRYTPGGFPVCFVDNAKDIDALAYVVASRLELFPSIHDVA